MAFIDETALPTLRELDARDEIGHEVEATLHDCSTSP
jgi:hypothetical protein